MTNSFFYPKWPHTGEPTKKYYYCYANFPYTRFDTYRKCHSEGCGPLLKYIIKAMKEQDFTQEEITAVIYKVIDSHGSRKFFDVVDEVLDKCNERLFEKGEKWEQIFNEAVKNDPSILQSRERLY